MSGSDEGTFPVDGILVTLAALGALLLLAPRVDPLTTDALSYLDVAENLHAGRGLVQAVVDFWRPAVPDPLGLWPPLYPALVALATYALPLEAAGRAVAVGSFAAFAFLFHGLAARVLGRGLGALATVCALAAPGVLAVGLHAWSEATFLALVAGALALLAGRAPAGWTPAGAAFAGLLLGLAAVTRNAGLPLVAVGAVAVALAGDARRACRLAFVVAALAPPLAWGVRNLAVFGRPLGPELPPARLGMATQAAELARALRWELVPAPFDGSPLPGIALALLLGGGVVLALARGGLVRTVAGVGLVLVAVVLAATSASAINAPTGRYLAPALPFLTLAALAGLAGDATAKAATRRRLATGLVAVLALATAVEAISLPARADVAGARADRAALAHLVGPGDAPVLSDAGHLVRLAAGRAAVQVPPPAYRPRDYDGRDDARWAAAGVHEAVFAAGAPPAGTWTAVTTAGRFTAYRRVAASPTTPSTGTTPANGTTP